ncbi:hypothetical protein BH09ACT8_BH09ACT8_21580 [soil metagenome]
MWVGAGVLTAGVSAAMLAGAGAASADTDAGTNSGSTGKSAVGNARSDAGRPAGHSVAKQGKSRAVGTPTSEKASASADGQVVAHLNGQSPTATKPGLRTVSATTIHTGRAARTVAPATEQTPTLPGIGDIIGPFQPDYPPLVRAVGSAIFNFIGAIVQTADGPPIVPPDLRDSIQVSSSTLVIAPGTEVAADWYFPSDGSQPQRLIYLQHGILASGPMYSYTASYLAQRTNSVVVVTTITSNPFADGGMWLGGDNLHNAVAQLFLDDDRQALNASLTTATLNAGGSALTVPDEFVLVGHSLGGGFAPGVAGHYAEGLVARRADAQDSGDETNYLAGVVTLDGVPFDPILPNAMDRLKALENSNNGDPADYVPVYEIGAPLNFLNSQSKVNEELSDARPGKFNGVVVNGGVHMDSMLGGNPLIQASAYLVAGIPQPQNPPAVQLLMAGWVNDMFARTIDPATGRCLGPDCQGTYGDPGATIYIPTDEGQASAVVIDSGTLPPPAFVSTEQFTPLAAESIPMSIAI